MAYVPCKKGTVLVPSGPSYDQDKKHLFIICTDECADKKFLIVPVSSWTNNLCDSTCVIEPHEHSFVKHKSYVLYRNGLIISRADLEAGVLQMKIFPKEDMNGQSFLRIKNGVCVSQYTPRNIKNYFGCEVSKPESA